MALKSLSFLMILVASSLFSVSTAFDGRKALAPDAADSPSPSVDWGFVPLNTKDPKVIELAQFAIDQYNKEHNSKLVYTALFEAIAVSIPQGTKYGLIVAATSPNNELNDYTVNVLVDTNNKKLVFFQENQ
ncbi:hypothetical protein DH2020_017195 [Rehmannia glutinosa]|uniref:Cystatin domain-containing protein n=1 Tax=Rehmannia glutinosa TaxID=99300 RepID=A0ABR0WUF7_REHGL